MSSRSFMRLLVAALLPLSVLAAADRPPNIIIIYADDVGYGDLGCYGAKAVATPQLDRLARGGMRFTSAYATASTCTPSRYSLLTGEYAFRNTGAVILPGNAPLLILPTQPTLASLLSGRGYTTGLVGKWHLGLGDPKTPLDWNGDLSPGPRELGFAYSFHMAATGDRVPAVYIKNGRVVKADPADPISVDYDKPIGTDPAGLTHPHLLQSQADEQHAKTIVDGISRIGYMSGGQAARWTDEELPDTFLREAVGFIERHQKEPFFLFYAMHENHVPRIPHPRFRGSSGLGVRGDAVVQMDWSIGVVIESLARLGLTENTLVIFSSDNGPVLYDGYYDGALEQNGQHRAAGPWRGGKYSAWEGGTRMPFIVSWPGKVAAGRSDAIISQVDLFASLAHLTGAKVPAGAARDSRQLLDTLLGRTEVGRDQVIQQGVNLQAIRHGDWKYLPPGQVTNRAGIDEFARDVIRPPGALFFLPEDPEERHDVAALYPAKVRQLRAILESEMGRPLGQPSPGDGLGGAKQN